MRRLGKLDFCKLFCLAAQTLVFTIQTVEEETYKPMLLKRLSKHTCNSEPLLTYFHTKELNVLKAAV